MTSQTQAKINKNSQSTATKLGIMDRKMKENHWRNIEFDQNY